MKDWIVYSHYVRNPNDPFYIGACRLVRRPMELRNRNRFWIAHVRKNKGFKVEILFKTLTKEQALSTERKLIRKYGRLDLLTGRLVNITDGGQGPKNPNVETRKKIGANKGKKFPAWWRRKLSRARVGKEPWNKGNVNVMPQKLRDKISNSLKGNIPWNKGLKLKT